MGEKDDGEIFQLFADMPDELRPLGHDDAEHEFAEHGMNPDPLGGPGTGQYQKKHDGDNILRQPPLAVEYKLKAIQEGSYQKQHDRSKACGEEDGPKDRIFVAGGGILRGRMGDGDNKGENDQSHDVIDRRRGDSGRPQLGSFGGFVRSGCGPGRGMRSRSSRPR